VLRLIGGQYRAHQGEVLFDGQDVTQMQQPALYAARRRMGMLFQFGALFTDMSVFDNVAFPLREHTPLSEELIRDIVLMKLDAVGLRGARDLMPSEISGGMSRRVALARAIALDPDLIMYDEPFAGLDPISLGPAARLIRRLNDSLGVTSIVVSHDVDETFAIADHVIMLANGKVAAQGTPAELRACADPLIHQFVNALSEGPVPFHYPGVSVQDDFGVQP
jgi:phospholipid/cholesterol/gamma-HCH transport system ATP-binding protein